MNTSWHGRRDTNYDFLLDAGLLPTEVERAADRTRYTGREIGHFGGIPIVEDERVAEGVIEVRQDGETQVSIRQMPDGRWIMLDHAAAARLMAEPIRPPGADDPVHVPKYAR